MPTSLPPSTTDSQPMLANAPRRLRNGGIRADRGDRGTSSDRPRSPLNCTRATSANGGSTAPTTSMWSSHRERCSCRLLQARTCGYAPPRPSAPCSLTMPIAEPLGTGPLGLNGGPPIEQRRRPGASIPPDPSRPPRPPDSRRRGRRPRLAQYDAQRWSAQCQAQGRCWGSRRVERLLARAGRGAFPEAMHAECGDQIVVGTASPDARVPPAG